MKEMEFSIHNFSEGIWTLTCVFLWAAVHNSLQQAHCTMHRGRRPLGEWRNYNALNRCFYLEIVSLQTKVEDSCVLYHAWDWETGRLSFFFCSLIKICDAETVTAS
jgi:hypothetical protein